MVILINAMLIFWFYPIRDQSECSVSAWGRTRDARKPTPLIWIYTADLNR